MPTTTPAARTANLGLPENGAAIWLTFLDDIGESERDAYRALLDPGEVARHDRYMVTGARDEFLVGRALLRTTLSRYRDVAPGDWRFETNRYGRPAIVGEAPGGLVFNLSHTRGLVALAVSHGCEIGVDVEAVGRQSATFDLAGRYFSQAEGAWVRAAAGPALAERFFAVWTLKEAYIKARGMGLALPLDGFSFTLDDDAGAPTIAFHAGCPDDPVRWAFLRRPVSADHRLAFAVSPPARIGAVRFLRTIPLSGSATDLDAADPAP
ncbi:4'-phosphopantetheinyl transferase superfamily protein [Aurantimonas sp. A2-1-M11]|uniref:4'-phosphopantetheinyl transferase family protein n=1 Tax=Aurantimonas sp. A2-1-M11 TaxID=3113712 RepID=UPI002F93B8EB